MNPDAQTAYDQNILTLKRFAVIVDEAHSSQSGDTATELKRILNGSGIEAVSACLKDFSSIGWKETRRFLTVSCKMLRSETWHHRI